MKFSLNKNLFNINTLRIESTDKWFDKEGNYTIITKYLMSIENIKKLLISKYI